MTEWETVEPGTGRPRFDNKGITLADVHATFRHWLGQDYDTGALDAVLATAAVERLEGDPVWLLYVAGSGGGKTETVTALAGMDGVLDVSTLSSEGALLSATKAKEKASDATGGILCELGDRGTILVKDFTSILTMNLNTREGVLRALREVYDGSWVRAVGTDGGRTIHWSGRVVIVGACTTAWDTATATVSVMGDRFLLIRTPDPSNDERAGHALQAIRNLGRESNMRHELRSAAQGLVASMDPRLIPTMTDDELLAIVRASNLVTRMRSAVEFGYKGELTWVHDAERPTRFAKQLGQVWRGACALGMPRQDALDLALRVARDTCPPLRLAILEALKDGALTTRQLGQVVERPRSSLAPTLEALGPTGMRLLTSARLGDHQTAPTVWSLAVDTDLASLSGNMSGNGVARARDANPTPNSPTHISRQAPATPTVEHDEEPF